MAEQAEAEAGEGSGGDPQDDIDAIMNAQAAGGGAQPAELDELREDALFRLQKRKSSTPY